MRIKYQPKRFSLESKKLIVQANEIITEYEDMGYELTLRQLYYQFVARDFIPNTMESYKKLQRLVSNARLAGLLSWTAIVDRTRNLQQIPTWDSPRDVIGAARRSYRIDMWDNQDVIPEVWIEKEALIGVIEDTCRMYGIPYFACRGNVSQSELWRAGQRIRARSEAGQETVIFHLGDHDPSGIDMTRDNDQRSKMFSHYETEVRLERLALNMDQVEEYDPPANPAKTTDSRYNQYTMRYGTNSWELDALDPPVINQLIEDAINDVMDHDKWAENVSRQEEDEMKLDDIIASLED